MAGRRGASRVEDAKEGNVPELVQIRLHLLITELSYRCRRHSELKETSSVLPMVDPNGKMSWLWCQVLVSISKLVVVVVSSHFESSPTTPRHSDILLDTLLRVY